MSEVKPLTLGRAMKSGVPELVNWALEEKETDTYKDLWAPIAKKAVKGQPKEDWYDLLADLCYRCETDENGDLYCPYSPDELMELLDR